MLRSPFRVQTSFRSPHSPPVASPSAVPDLPKLRVLGSSLSRWQIPVFCTDTQGPIFSAMFPIPPWHVVFPLSEHLWSTEAQIGYLLLAHPHLLCKSEKLKAMLNQNSETRLWTSIRILFNFLKKKPADRKKKNTSLPVLENGCVCVCINKHRVRVDERNSRDNLLDKIENWLTFCCC